MSIATVEKQGTTLIVCPEGRLDILRSPKLEQEIDPHLEGVSQIVMDFSKVMYISSSGLRLLLRLEQMMEDRGGEVQVTHADEVVRHALDLAGFLDIVHVVEE